jgi:spore maturation protein CgeB
MHGQMTMKILLSSYHNPHFITITEYMENAIRRLGHELISFDDRQHIIPGRIRYRIPWLNQLDLKRLNRQLVLLALEKNPDIAIIAGGHRVTPSTIKALNAQGIITVLWTIDAPINFTPILAVAPFYRHIFCQGTEAVELLEYHGIKNAHWLPVGCDMNVHRRVELTTEEVRIYSHDIVFVGSYYPERAALFENLVDFDFAIWGPGWHQLEEESPLKGHIKGLYSQPAEWITIYSASKIVLATHYRDPQNRFPVYQASPRIFEALACKCFVLVDGQRDVFSLFNDGEHLAGFDGAEDLRQKIEYFLAHSQKRNRIAKQGFKEVSENHTFIHRITELLATVGEGNEE